MSNQVWTITAVVVAIVLVIGVVTVKPKQASAPEPTPQQTTQGNTETRSAYDTFSDDVINRVQTMDKEITPITKPVKVTLKTTMGDIVMELYGTDAPKTVGNFVKLAESNFYDGTTFHRVIPNFMIQGGDPTSLDPNARQFHGTGGPGYTFEDEINSRKIVRGSVAMANGGPDTNGSQFFIVTAEATPHLDGVHTNFGQVTEGMDIVDAISNVQRDQRDNPVERVVIEDVVISDL